MSQLTTNLAISTSWNARRHTSTGAMLDEIQALGARRVEISSVTEELLHDLEEALARRSMAIPSVHNPCPWPTDASGERVDWRIPDSLSCPEEKARNQALTLARQSIAWTARLGARVLILHLGTLRAPLPQNALFALLKAGNHEELVALRERALAERALRAEAQMPHALASIRTLGEEAARQGVALGIEVRDGYDEIPNLEEMEMVMAATEGLPVGYWHDVGHAEKQRLLGLATPADYLQRFSTRLLGVHLHDSIYDHDHLAPGYGTIDLATTARLLPAEILHTLEISERIPFHEAQAGIAHLHALGLA